MGPRSSAGPLRSLTSGRVSLAKRSSRASVALDSSRKVGKTRKVSASSRSREAVAAKTSLEFWISWPSAPSRSLMAPNTTPVFFTNPRTDDCCSSSTLSRSAPSVANGSRLPKAEFRSEERPPLIASASSLIQVLNAARVSLSNAEKISSSSTVSST